MCIELLLLPPPSCLFVYMHLHAAPVSEVKVRIGNEAKMAPVLHVFEHTCYTYFIKYTVYKLLVYEKVTFLSCMIITD